MSGQRIAAPLALLVLLAWGRPTDLRAQGARPVLVQGQRDLAFGVVFADVAKTISRLDPANSGAYQIRGSRNAEVTFTFTLPTALQSAGGQTMLTEFGADDAAFSRNPSPAGAVGFDPQRPFVARLDGNGRGYIWLGGTLRPTSGQAPGQYQGAVVLTVAYTGN